MKTKERASRQSQMVNSLFLRSRALEAPGLSGSHRCKITTVMTEAVMNST